MYADRLAWLAVQVLLCLCLVRPAPAQNYWNVHTFSGNDGRAVESIVLSDGTFYGVTSFGSVLDLGAVFSVNLDGSNYRLLKWFAGNGQGAHPAEGIVLVGSTLFGTTQPSNDDTNYGCVYRINSDGTDFAVLKSFSGIGDEAGGPSGGLVLGGSKLYGVLRGYDGNTTNYAGAVYSINTDGTGYNVVKSLNGTGAATPICTLVLSGAELFGTTTYDGYYRDGTVFKVNTNGTGFAVLVTFNANNAAKPFTGVTLGGSTLYGVTEYGGTYGRGAVYRVNTDGTGFAVLKNFRSDEGSPFPFFPPVVDGSVLYGEASGKLFRMNTDGTGYTVLVTNCYPRCFLMSGATLYGGGVDNLFGLASTSGPPVIAAGPASQTAAQGDSVSLEVHAAGAVPLSYQWFFHQAQPLSGAANPVLQLADIQPAQAGSYTVVITNALGAATSAPAMLTVLPASSLPVTSLTDAGLRAALAAGTTVTFGADGVLPLAGTLHITSDTVLDGSAHQVVLSGGGLVPLFEVHTNVTLTLLNLILCAGNATNGGAIWNCGGTVNLVGVSVSTNFAHNLGGGICNQGGRLNATNCSFSCNLAGGALSSTAGSGGGIESEGPGALVCLERCIFYGNVVGLGEHGVSTNDLSGGAIYNAGILTAHACTFLQNSAASAPYPDRGGRAGLRASGGAVDNAGTLLLQCCLFASNTVSGGVGAQGNIGQFTGVFIPGGPGGLGKDGCGAALANEGVATAINCCFVGNQSAGGPGGVGGPGAFAYVGGGHYGYGPGGNGGNGGNGRGALYSTNAQLSLINCTIASNSSTAGVGGPGGSGGLGWPAYPYPGTNGTASGSLTVSAGSLVNTLISGGVPRNFDGSITDRGHNLSSDASCYFANPGSLNSTDPKLGPLADNGGPTLTMALLAGSPAIDAGDSVSAPVTDQRGYPRPAGVAPDIGAFEYGSVMPTLTISGPIGTTLTIVGRGNVNQLCRLLVSTDLLNWSVVATNQIGSDGTASFHDNYGARGNKFYRLVMP